MNVIAAIVLLLQSESPDESFKSLEAALEQTEQLSLRWKVQTDRGGRDSATGILVFAQEDKIFLKMNGIRDEKRPSVALISDGKKLKWYFNGGEYGEENVPKGLGKDLRRCFLRGGAAMTFHLESGLSPTGRKPGKTPDIEKSLRVSALVPGKEESLKTLSYKLSYSVQDTPMEADMKLFYDPEKRGILKRAICVKGQEEKAGTETYEEMPFDALAAEDMFTLADAKMRREVTKARIEQLSDALNLFKLDQNRYPGQLADLVAMPAYVDPKRWPPGGYLKKAPRDAWGAEYIYRVPGTSGQPYDIGSLGDDGREGGEGPDEDIWNHDAGKK